MQNFLVGELREKLLQICKNDIEEIIEKEKGNLFYWIFGLVGVNHVWKRWLNGRD